MYKDSRHIGDGVYVSDDDYQLWLAVNHHTNHVIALEPGVCLRLIEQMTRVVNIEAIQRVVDKMKEDQGCG